MMKKEYVSVSLGWFTEGDTSHVKSNVWLYIYLFGWIVYKHKVASRVSPKEMRLIYGYVRPLE